MKTKTLIFAGILPITIIGICAGAFYVIKKREAASVDDKTDTEKNGKKDDNETGSKTNKEKVTDL